MGQKGKARLIFCQACGQSQVVEGVVLPCIVCGRGIFGSSRPAFAATRQDWAKLLSPWDLKWLKSMRISAE